jgi:hypothetical protein
MRKTILIATVLAAIVPMIASAQSSDGYYSGSYTRMSYVKGDVYVQRGQDLGYEQGALNLVVVEGDKIGTKDGRVEIQLGRRNYLRLDGSTQVDVTALPGGDSDPTKLHLLSGSIFVRVNSLTREKNIEIHTPDASFYLIEEGLYRIDVRDNRETEFGVWSGSAEAAGEEGSTLVRNGERITAANGRFTSEPDGLSARRDDFSAWNEDRDVLFARRSTKTYLPAEYADYENELADNGDWAYESSYGNVWVPRHTSSDWRPYYDGRWAWYPIIGWTWISYEPWGWCTSHYGRWGWGMDLGWYWIPYSRWSWGPAWVHWYWDRDYIGWCPLSYYNYPAVFVNNRFYDRYTNGRFPGNSRTLTMVHRGQLQDHQLRRVALDQNRISKIGNISLRAAQPDLRPSINRDGATAVKARGVLSRESLRSVGKSFNAGGRKLSANELRSSITKRSPEGGSASERKVINERLRDSSSDRTIRNDSSRLVPRSSIQKGGAAATVRSFPSRRTFENDPVHSVDRSRINPSVRNGKDSVSARLRNETVTPRSRTDDNGPSGLRRNDGGQSGGWPSQGDKAIREVRPKTIEPPASSRSANSERIIKERGGNNEGASSVPRRSLQQESERRVTAPAERPSRNIVRNDASSPARRSAPSRSSSAPSRITSSPTRGSSAPSRSSRPSSRSYSAPSPGSSAPSRSLSSPSRSSSSPSRSYSAPSRSYSAPSRSSGSSSRSSSAPSRSSSGSSRGSSSSGSGGRIRK